LGVVLGGTVGFASPKDDAHHGKGRTLTVLAKSRQATVVDVGQKGPSQGDTRVVNAPLYDKSGKEKVGRIDLYCVATDPADRPNEKANMAICTNTYTLRNGEISAQGVNAFPKLPAPPPRSLDAITGGTEKFEGARGETSAETRGRRTFFTFHFTD
jgi:hypothetical protein